VLGDANATAANGLEAKFRPQTGSGRTPRSVVKLPNARNPKRAGNPCNLLRRPDRPAQGRGRVQRGVWEALVFAGGLATTGAVLEQIYPGKRLQNGGWYELVRRRLDEIADRVGRDRGRGRAWLWRLRPGHAPPRGMEPWPEDCRKSNRSLHSWLEECQLSNEINGATTTLCVQNWVDNETSLRARQRRRRR
jgi:hypothetical protein